MGGGGGGGERRNEGRWVNFQQRNLQDRIIVVSYSFNFC